MFSTMSLIRLAKYGIPALIAGILLWQVASGLIDHGKSLVQEDWDADVAEQREEVERLQADIDAREVVHRAEVRRLNNQLGEASRRHSVELASLRAGYALQLRESDERVRIYQRLSETGAVGRANLASYAAQLDRSLVEGRLVVGELRATVIQRDEQLRAVGEQLAADRRLINGTPEERP